MGGDSLVGWLFNVDVIVPITSKNSASEVGQSSWKNSESIEWFVKDQALLLCGFGSYPALFPPLASESGLFFSVFLLLPVELTDEKGGSQGGGGSLVLCKSFNTLWKDFKKHIYSGRSLWFLWLVSSNGGHWVRQQKLRIILFFHSSAAAVSQSKACPTFFCQWELLQSLRSSRLYHIVIYNSSATANSHHLVIP